MAKFAHDHIVPFKNSTLDKKEQVGEMFDCIADRYDFLNRFLSGGIDIYWRRKAIGRLKDLDPKNILDVATGTGDVAIMLAKKMTQSNVTGIDISKGMLEVGQGKIDRLNLAGRVRLMQGDAEALPFEDDSFDAITVAFGVRNFQHLEKGLTEMLRVLKPGGRLMILEFSRPRKWLFKQLYQFYMKRITPGLGKLISRNAAAYSYLDESVRAFPEGDQFLEYSC